MQKRIVQWLVWLKEDMASRLQVIMKCGGEDAGAGVYVNYITSLMLFKGWSESFYNVI